MGTTDQAERWKTLIKEAGPFFAVRAIGKDGLSYLRLKNYGAELAAADIIAFTDSDVFPHSTWLSSLVEGLETGGDVSMGLSLFKSAGSWEWDRPTRLAAASITWGWVVGKAIDPRRGTPMPAGFMDHNFGLRAGVFRRSRYSSQFNRLCGAPLLMRSLRDEGAYMVLQPRQRVTHYFAWRYWLVSLHFRYGYEVYMLRRLNDQYPDQWIRQLGVLEPVATMAWHVMLDVPRWFRFSRLLGIAPLRRVAILPLVIILSCAARFMEMMGMYRTMRDPEGMREWAESV
jgi:hypothetical protein